MLQAPWAFLFSGCLRRRVINLTPPRRRVKARGTAPWGQRYVQCWVTPDRTAWHRRESRGKKKRASFTRMLLVTPLSNPFIYPLLLVTWHYLHNPFQQLSLLDKDPCSTHQSVSANSSTQHIRSMVHIVQFYCILELIKLKLFHCHLWLPLHFYKPVTYDYGRIPCVLSCTNIVKFLKMLRLLVCHFQPQRNFADKNTITLDCFPRFEAIQHYRG